MDNLQSEFQYNYIDITVIENDDNCFSLIYYFRFFYKLIFCDYNGECSLFNLLSGYNYGVWNVTFKKKYLYDDKETVIQVHSVDFFDFLFLIFYVTQKNKY